MVKTRVPERQRLILDNVSWQEYTRLLQTFEDRHIRLTYDRGLLEIMTLSHEHESDSDFLGRMVVTLTEELKLPLKAGRSTTFRKKKKRKGIEPDNCYWIAHEAQVRGKRVINLLIDPAPDLAIEVDVTHSSMDRMRIYASLNVPEVWRRDSRGLQFLVLNAAGTYDSVGTSPTFSLPIAPDDLQPFLALRDHLDENEVISQFRTWIRSKLPVQP